MGRNKEYKGEGGNKLRRAEIKSVGPARAEIKHTRAEIN